MTVHNYIDFKTIRLTINNTTDCKIAKLTFDNPMLENVLWNQWKTENSKLVWCIIHFFLAIKVAFAGALSSVSHSSRGNLGTRLIGTEIDIWSFQRNLAYIYIHTRAKITQNGNAAITDRKSRLNMAPCRMKWHDTYNTAAKKTRSYHSSLDSRNFLTLDWTITNRLKF